MGDMADDALDYAYSQILDLFGDPDDNQNRKFSQGHVLDNDYWCTNDLRTLYPAKGEMDENHIRNVMAMLRRPNVIGNLQDMETDLYLNTPEWLMPHGDGACDAFDRELDGAMDLQCSGPGEYFNRRIRRSKLWKSLKAGLTFHYGLKQKANDLNKGVLEL